MWIKKYLLALLSLVVLDLMWFGVIAKNFYEKELGHLLRDTTGSTTYLPAAAVYLILALGIILFPLSHYKNPKKRRTAVIYGALFGFVFYGGYELTNYALIRGWPIILVPFDTIWGMVLCGFATWVCSLIRID